MDWNFVIDFLLSSEIAHKRSICVFRWFELRWVERLRWKTSASHHETFLIKSFQKPNFIMSVMQSRWCRSSEILYMGALQLLLPFIEHKPFKVRSLRLSLPFFPSSPSKAWMVIVFNSSSKLTWQSAALHDKRPGNIKKENRQVIVLLVA